MVFYLLAPVGSSAFVNLLAIVVLIMGVLSAVHHAEVVAHKVGEPYGTIILALAVTVLEASIIVSLMLAGGAGADTYARDTLFAAVMLILNGILGISMPQLIAIGVCCLVIYGAFIFIQTVRHRNYFLTEEVTGEEKAVTRSDALISLGLLIVCLAVVVFLAKKLSPVIEAAVVGAGLPTALVGVAIAAVILMPEGVAAVRAARRNQYQTSINLALGSALASIGLSIPTVAVICTIMDLPLVLGLDNKSMVLLGLSVFTVMLSLNKGRTNGLYAAVLLVNLMMYIFTIIFA